MFKLVSVWWQTAESLEHIRLYNNPYLPHEYKYPLDTEYMTLGDLYFDRSHEDSGYIVAASLLRMFQLDNALQHKKKNCYLSVFLRGDCVCTCVQSNWEFTTLLLTHHEYLYLYAMCQGILKNLEGGVW